MIAISQNVDLKPLTSLALPGAAEYFCAVESNDQLMAALDYAKNNQLQTSLLAGGSNTVVAGNVAGLVIKMATRGIRRVYPVTNDSKALFLEVAAGENWHQLVSYCLQQSWYGLENLALIPGSVGAAPIQNIGAYGVELADVLHSVSVWDIADNKRYSLSVKQCQFAYRDSIFKQSLKGRVVITSVTLQLTTQQQSSVSYPALAELLSATSPSRPPTPQDVFNAVCQLRQQKLPDPALLPNAGSFFKNPLISAELAARLTARYPQLPMYPQGADKLVATDAIKTPCMKVAAAWLIDHAGWKGFQENHVGVHKNQALVLVNFGQATGQELLALAAKLTADVANKYGIDLEREPVVIGAE